MPPTILRFSRSHGPYRAGELAGFEAEEAEALVAQGCGQVVPKGDLKPAGKVPAAGPPPKLVVVQFVRQACAGHPSAGYRAGDIAGFDTEEAGRLIRAGDAVVYSAAAPARVAPLARAPEQLVQVKFLKGSDSYRKGEVAAFTHDRAAELAAQKVVKILGDAPVPKPRATDPDPKSVDPDVTVLGLDDRDPDWREPASKTEPKRKG
jgi:hypothetical protein